MSDLVTAFCESEIERIKPLLSAPRLVCFFILVLSTSPSAERVFSNETLNESLTNSFLILTEALEVTPLLNYLVLIFFVFVVAPFLTAYLIKLITEKIHCPRSSGLISNLEATAGMPDVEIEKLRVDQLTALSIRKLRGIRRVRTYWAMSEILLYAFLGLVLSIYFLAISVFVATILFAAIFVAFYFFTQKMFISFLSEIKPYDVIRQRLSISE